MGAVQQPLYGPSGSSEYELTGLYAVTNPGSTPVKYSVTGLTWAAASGMALTTNGRGLVQSHLGYHIVTSAFTTGLIAVYSSPDTFTWTLNYRTFTGFPSSSNIDTIAWNKSTTAPVFAMYCSVGPSRIITTSDFITFQTRRTFTHSAVSAKMLWDGTRFLLMMQQTGTAGGYSHACFIESDATGVTWSDVATSNPPMRDAAFNAAFRDLVKFGSYYVVSGIGTDNAAPGGTIATFAVVYSTDLATWLTTTGVLDSGGDPAPASPLVVTPSGLFVMLGDSQRVFQTSGEPVTWTLVNSASFSSGANGACGVYKNSKILFAMTDGHVLVSSDGGGTWTKTASALHGSSAKIV